MNNAAIGDYIEEGYGGHDVFIPDEVYGTVLDALVIACTDIVVVYDKRILLGKRTRHPQADWWIVGGRMRTGESLGRSSQRLLFSEAGLEISVERFSYLTTFAAAWEKRAHAPETNGTHTVSLVMMVEITPEEFARITLNDEYSEKKLVSVDELLDASLFHPALTQCARSYQQRNSQV